MSGSARVDAVRPFVPATNLQVSKRFYQQLGFTVAVEFGEGNGCILEIDSCSFILHDCQVAAHIEHYMMQLVVSDIDVWWERIQAAKLHETYGVRPPTPPKMQPWGVVVSYVVDPSGVLWHVIPSGR